VEALAYTVRPDGGTPRSEINWRKNAPVEKRTPYVAQWLRK
jgi:hypothetical protein